METYFHKDPRIEEWIDQITEKVFTVCLLNGADSEIEFQKGCQIVTKVTSLLQGISTFPTEYLEDGLKQLLEQQLPDARVINNFPSFQDTMDKMLHEGMSKAINSANKEVINASISLIKINEENNIEDYERTVGKLEETLIEEPLIECVIPALATAFNYPEIQESESEFQSHELGETISDMDANLIELASDYEENVIKTEPEIEPSFNLKSIEELPTCHVSETEAPLKAVLSKLFPDSSVCWNVKILGQTLLAKVENILICVLESDNPSFVKELKQEGWKVFVCRSVDLSFPRRLERGIKQIHRLGKKS